MVIIYRQATEKDIPKLIDIGQTAYGQFQNKMLPQHFKQLMDHCSRLKLYQELIQKGTAFIAEDGQESFGMAFLINHNNETDIFKKEWAYIRMIGVKPNYGGKGIGKKLTQICIEKAKQDNEKIIALHTAEIMASAEHIYKKIGFKLHQKLPQRLGLNYNLYLYHF